MAEVVGPGCTTFSAAWRRLGGRRVASRPGDGEPPNMSCPKVTTARHRPQEGWFDGPTPRGEPRGASVKKSRRQRKVIKVMGFDGYGMSGWMWFCYGAASQC